MQRQQGLVPGAEALVDLPALVKALRETSPQAVHHFTKSGQLQFSPKRLRTRPPKRPVRSVRMRQ